MKGKIMNKIIHDEKPHIATALYNGMLWLGFGITEAEAEDALVNQINEFYEETITKENLRIKNFIWIQNNGCCIEL